VRLAKPRLTVDPIALDVEMEDVRHLVESLSLIARRTVEPVVIMSVISRLRTLVSVQKIVGIVEMVFVMPTEERTKCLVKWIVV